MTEHPITPPPELVQQWRNMPEYASQLRTMSMVTITTEKLQDIATQAARWGADKELEACISAILSHRGFEHPDLFVELLRASRRPKPPSLKEQALAVIENSEICDHLSTKHAAIIRRALEQLDD